MRFQFIVNKNANFYFFLHNLAECEWPWPYRPWNNKTWKKELGEFSREEKKALKRFKKIYRNHFLKIYLGKPFFLRKNPWQALRKKIPSKELEDLKSVFSIWQEKFEKIYEKDLPNLKKWEKMLTKEMKKNERISVMRLFQEIVEKLYKSSFPRGKIKIYLMLCGRPGACGGERGRGLDSNRILLELSRRLFNESMDYVIGVLCHEITHNCSHCYLQPLLLKVLKSQKKARHIEELINRTLTPIGIFSIRFLNGRLPLSLTGKNDPIGKINPTQTVRIINLTDRYIKEKKAIDARYIKELLQILKKGRL